MSVYGKVKMKAFAGASKIKRIYLGGAKIYSAGNTVTYCVDEGVEYQEEVDSGASCTHPTTFIPIKSGWTFVGWKTNTNADGYVLDSETHADKIMGDEPITLYALFKQTVTLTYNGNGATSGSVTSQNGTRYYNNGNIANPSFALKANGYTKTDYTFCYWKAGDVYYTEGAEVSFAQNTTIYAEWAQTVVEYGYTGAVETFVAPVTGLYQLEAYGAQGDKGNSGTKRYDGGLGGYSKGDVYLYKDEVVYVCVGDGGNEVGYAANYNGGGSVERNVSNQHEGGAGGGATHFAKVTGLLAELANQVSKILMVAGGGGGGGASGRGGTGGGTSGGYGYTGNNTVIHSSATGGTQTSGNDFGIGASSGPATSGGGGGGYYGGKLGGNSNGASGGGGGSGYIGGVTNGSMSNGVNSGSGKATVTLKDARAFEMSFGTAPKDSLIYTGSGIYSMSADTSGDNWRVSDECDSSVLSTDGTASSARVYFDNYTYFKAYSKNRNYVFDFDAPISGNYELSANVVLANSGGYADIYINNVKVGRIDTYNAEQKLETFSLGTVRLRAGEFANKIKIVPTGASGGSKYYPSIVGFSFTAPKV